MSAEERGRARAKTITSVWIGRPKHNIKNSEKKKNTFKNGVDCRGNRRETYESPYWIFGKSIAKNYQTPSCRPGVKYSRGTCRPACVSVRARSWRNRMIYRPLRIPRYSKIFYRSYRVKPVRFRIRPHKYSGVIRMISILRTRDIVGRIMSLRSTPLGRIKKSFKKLCITF